MILDNIPRKKKGKLGKTKQQRSNFYLRGGKKKEKKSTTQLRKSKPHLEIVGEKSRCYYHSKGKKENKSKELEICS